jgi:hypothetical protein
LKSEGDPLSCAQKLETIICIAGHFTSFISALGQLVLMTSFNNQKELITFLATLCVVRWLLFYALTFFNKTLINSKAFQYCMIFILVVFTSITLMIEIMIVLGSAARQSSDHVFLGRLLMHSGWLHMYLVIRLYFTAKQHEEVSLRFK